MTAGTANHETMLQCFEWYLPDDHGLWNWIAAQAQDLAAAGFTMAWLPPAYKGQAGDADVGYGVYDMYDLGEFDAKGSVPTKYGSRGDYLGAIRTLHGHGLRVLADIVFNHRMGADGEERVTAHVVDVDDRTVNDRTAIERTLDTVYDFPERDGTYSTFRWNWRDFTGTDYTANDGSAGIMRFAGKQWSDNVSHERGNFDYIMGDDVDVNEPEVVKELTDWGAIVIKFWVQIDKDTQLKRFTDRQNTPEKQWKITDEDWRNREKWDMYEDACQCPTMTGFNVTVCVDVPCDKCSPERMLKACQDVLDNQRYFHIHLLMSADGEPQIGKLKWIHGAGADFQRHFHRSEYECC